MIKVSTIIMVKQEVDIIKDDPSDNIFLACAIEGPANFIISGNKHLKTLGQYQGIRIVEPTDFLDRGVDSVQSPDGDAAPTGVPN